MRLIVITGGPCVGKTTVLNLLKKQGFMVLPEQSKPIIDKYRQENEGVVPWETKDSEWFQNEVFEKQLQEEKRLVGDKICFIESSLLDRVAICEYEGVKVPDKIIDEIKKSDYEKIFFLEALPNELYEDDSHRPKGYEHSKEIRKAVETYYLNSNFKIIRVPFEKPEKRVEFILTEVM
jgi:predicted ATPase